MKRIVLTLMAIASLSQPSQAQLGEVCSSLKDIYVLPRQTYPFTVTGSCIHTDSRHSPYLTKEAYQALKTKPTVIVFY